jgi:hypothetical protein
MGSIHLFIAKSLEQGESGYSLARKLMDEYGINMSEISDVLHKLSSMIETLKETENEIYRYREGY